MKKAYYFVIIMIFISINSYGEDNTKALKEPLLKEGIYIGVGNGRGGQIKVEVTVHDDKIKDISILEENETKDVGGEAFEPLIKNIIISQKLNVDNIAGATETSNGVRNAVSKALEQAKNR